MSEASEYLSIPDHVPIKEAAKMLRISDDRVYYYVQSHRLEAKKISGRYMIPIKEIEKFKLNPPGRVRADPSKWRVYDQRTKLFNTHIQVYVRAGQQVRLEEKLRTLLEEQSHRIVGTMQRYILRNTATPDVVTISLFWKSNEMPDEATCQRDLEAFQDEFADVLDWSTAHIEHNEGLLYT